MDSVDFIFKSPNFIAPTLGTGIAYDGSTANWNVQDSSVAINNGFANSTELDLINTDYDGNKRIINTIDIGPYEHLEIDYSYILENSSNLNEINIYPNPVSTTAKIKANFQLTPKTILKVVNLSGQIVKEINNHNSKLHSIVDWSELESGIYFMQFYEADKKITQKRFVKM